MYSGQKYYIILYSRIGISFLYSFNCIMPCIKEDIVLINYILIKLNERAELIVI